MIHLLISSCVCFVVALFEFFLCIKDLKMSYFAPESATLQTLWLNIQICSLKLLCDWCVGYMVMLQGQFLTFACYSLSLMGRRALLPPPQWPVCVLVWWHDLTWCLKPPSQGSLDAQDGTASVPDKAVGASQWGSCDLANRSWKPETKPPPSFPLCDGVQCASSARCLTRSQEEAVDCHSGLVLHLKWEHRKGSTDPLLVGSVMYRFFWSSFDIRGLAQME